MSHLDDETLALRALGEGGAGDDHDAHLETCEQCRRALAAYAAVVTAGRRVEPADYPIAPRPQVWDRVLAEIHEADGAPPLPDDDAPRSADAAAVPAGVVPLEDRRSSRGRMRRLAPVAAAAAFGLLVGSGATWGLTRDTSPASPSASGGRVSVAALRPLDDPTASGRVVLRIQSPTRRTVTITVSGLPMQPGTFYEAWLMDPTNAHLVALGVLNSSGQGVFSVPPGLDLTQYSAVDVSLQPMNGSPLHSSNSAVRGSIKG